MEKEKETKQTTLIEKYEAVKKALDTGYKGLITEVTEKTNTEYFKKEGIYGEKKGIEITIKVQSPNGEEFTNWMHVPESVYGVSKSNLFAFEQRYKQLPRKGLVIDVVIDDNGFFKIVL